MNGRSMGDMQQLGVRRKKRHANNERDVTKDKWRREELWNKSMKSSNNNAGPWIRRSRLFPGEKFLLHLGGSLLPRRLTNPEALKKAEMGKLKKKRTQLKLLEEILSRKWDQVWKCEIDRINRGSTWWNTWKARGTVCSAPIAVSSICVLIQAPMKAISGLSSSRRQEVSENREMRLKNHLLYT